MPVEKKGKYCENTVMLPPEESARFKSCFDILPDQVFILDEKLDVVLANREAELFLGVPRAEMAGRPIDYAAFAARYGPGMEQLAAVVPAVAESGARQAFEILPDERGTREMAFKVTVRRAGTGPSDGVMVHIHDISLRLRVRRELLKRNAGLVEMARINKTIMEISSAIHTGDTLDDIFEIIFEQLRRIIPYDRIGLSLLDDKGEMLGVVKVKSGLPTQLGAGYRIKLAFSQSLTRLLEVGASERDEYCLLEGGRLRIIHDLGKYVTAKGRQNPYNDRLLEEGVRSSLTVPLYVQGRPTGFIFFSSRLPEVYTRAHLGEHYDSCMNSLKGIQDNIAVALEKAVAAKKLSDANARLKELLTMKDNFLSIASHDLRSPLTSIIGFGKMMVAKTPVNEVQRHGLEIMVNSAGHLLMLVDDILSLAKRNAGKMELNLEPYPVDRILRDSLQAMAFNAHNKEVTLDHRPLSPGPELSLDRLKMFQVFNNLIGNAIKFSPVGGAVTVRESFDGANYRFEVKDQGPGIRPEDLPRLFNMFVQVGGDEAKKGEGSGLGLAICKMIVEMHGGEVGASSALGEGALFYFTIPAKGGGGERD